MPTPTSPDLDDELDDDMDDSPDTPDPTPRDLRRAAKDGAKAKADLAAARRELAMLKAGVDTESPVGKLFVKAYDGDGDLEKIKAEWASVSGLVPAPNADSSTPDPDISDDERRSTSERQSLANGSVADITPTPDPRVASVNRADAVMKSGGTRDDAMAAMFDVLARAGAQGDRRVIIETNSSESS